MERWLVERVVLLLSLIAAVRAGSRYESASLIADFVADIETAPPGTKVVVFDVGANDGKWTSGVIAPILRRAARKGLVPHAYILEPQPVFREPLTRLAESLAPHVTFIAAAAWKQNTTLSLFSSERGSKSATLIPSKKSSGQSKDQTTTIDLAELIEGATRATDGERVITLLKLDVEGAEYTLLPWLLLHGVLCRPSYLLLEWHLATAPAEQRLEGLALRLTLDAMLHDGCEVPPLAILHDEFVANNIDVPIPGLRELVEWRTPSQEAKGSWTQGIWRRDMEHLTSRRALALPIEPIRVGQVRSVGERPRCYGACPTRCLADLHYVNASERSYRRSWLQPDTDETKLPPSAYQPQCMIFSRKRRANVSAPALPVTLPSVR